MMTKLISIVLSFTMIFMSVAPSYAQAARRPVSRRPYPAAVQDTTDPINWRPGVLGEQIYHKTMRKLADEAKRRENIDSQLQPLLAAFTAEENDGVVTRDGVEYANTFLDYDEFEKFYLGKLAEEEHGWIRKAKSQEEIRLIRSEFQKFRGDNAIAAAFMLAESEIKKDVEENPEKYKSLLKQELQPDIDAALRGLGVSGVAQSLVPLLSAYGLLSQDERKIAAAFYHSRLKSSMRSCGESSFDENQCKMALEMASSLSVVGADEREDQKDAELLRDFLNVGYKGPAAPMVVQVASQGLLALNAESLLGGVLLSVSREVNFTPIDVTLSMFSIQTYVEMFQELANSKQGLGSATFAEGLEYSFYPSQDPQFANKMNMWLDLGQVLAEMASDPQEERRDQIAALLSGVMEENVGFDSYGNPAVSFRPFVAGALLGGYQIQLRRPQSYDAWDAQGRIHHVKANVGAWQKLTHIIKSSGWTNSEFFSWYLYSLNKIDLDPSTEQYINNVLTAAHVKAAAKAGNVLTPREDGDITRYVVATYTSDNTPVVMESRKHPSAEAKAAYQNRQNWKKAGLAADIILVIFALWKVGGLAVKVGAQALRSGTRILKLARAGQLAFGGSLRMNMLRVVSRARTINKLPPLRSVMAETVANAAGIRRMKIEPMVTELRAARAARPVAPKPAVSAPKAEVRVLNGEQYMVFEGTETFYVRGQVVVEAKGTSLSELARKFNVPESEVAFAPNGSSWTGAKPSLNFGAGEAAPGSRGAQLRIDRPEISVPEPLFRVEAVKPQVDPALVKSGEKLAYVRQNNVWQVESVPQNLSRADVAKRFNVSADDVDYVVRLSDGTFAPEWSEFSDVWDVLRMPANRPFKKFEISKWQLFKARTLAGWDSFKGGVANLFDFSIHHPAKAAGMGGASFGLGGVAPVELFPTVAEVSSAAPRGLSFYELVNAGADVSFAPRAAAAAGETASAGAALETASSAANVTLQNGRMWLNPFWLFGAATSSHITPIGAIASADDRRAAGGRLSKWQSRAAFDGYRKQLNTWLYRSNPLLRSQNPWVLGDWWNDVKNSVSLDWQAFNLFRTGNPYYADWRISQYARASAAAETDEPLKPVAAAEPAAVSETAVSAEAEPDLKVPAAPALSSSGYLYSGLPIMELPRLTSKIRNGLRGLFNGKANHLAEDVLSRKVPLVTELRNIVLSDKVNENLKKQALLRLYQQFNAFDQVIKKLPEASRQKIHALEAQNNTDGVADFLYELYQNGFLTLVLSSLKNHIPTEQLAQELEAIIASPEFEAQRRAVYDMTDKMPPEDVKGRLRAIAEGIKDADPELVDLLAREAGWAVQSANDGREVSGGWIYYKNNVPVYYRHANGVLSDSPVIILHQDPLSSKFASVYASMWSKLRLGTKQGIKVPKGMVLALDENGKFKYVLRPGHRAELKDSKAADKMMKEVYENGSAPAVVDVPYSTTNLLVIAKALEEGVAVTFDLTLSAPNSFRAFVNALGVLSGLGVDSVMVGPFKAAAGPDNPVVPNAFGGVGYVTPRVAAELIDSMKSWGLERSVFTILSTMSLTLLTSVLVGINGLIDINNFSLWALAAPMVVLIVSGSLLRSVVPLLLNHYKNPQLRTVANLGVSAYQQGAKMGLFGITAAWKGRGGKFVAVPVAGLITLLAMGLFLNTPSGRTVVSEAVQSVVKHPVKSAESLLKGMKLVSRNLLKGTALGAGALAVWGWNKLLLPGWKWAAGKFKKSGAAAVASQEAAGAESAGSKMTEEEKTLQRYRKEYEENFLTDTEVKNSLLRVTLAYASYAASIMLLNQVAEGPVQAALESLWGKFDFGYGKIITTAFAAASFTVRLMASKWMLSGKATDDQLTGVSFLGLTLMPWLLAAVPYESWGILGVVLGGIVLNMSTAVPGQLDQVRLQNLVSAKIQAQKNAVLQDKSLSKEQKDAKIKDLEAKDNKWAGWAKSDYDKSNANGIWGVYAAIAASLFLPLLEIQNWSWIARTVFLYAGGVAAVGAVKSREMAFDFLKAVFSKKKALVITAADIAENKVSAAKFGIINENKANKMIPVLLKGKDNSLKTLKQELAPHGVIAIASEVKLTRALKRMIQIHNRLVASAEVLGAGNVRSAFEQLHALAQDYAAVLAVSNVSESLQREFGKLEAALCADGVLANGVAETPSYMEEGSFDMPANYRNLLEARDIILELRVLARNIRQGGSAVTPETYRRFVQYHAEARRLLQAYMAENPSESAIVKVEEENIRKLCRSLKQSNARNNLLRKNAGATPEQDIQNLEDILQAY